MTLLFGRFSSGPSLVPYTMQSGFHLGISSWGGELTDHMTVRPRRGEGRLHNYGNILGGGGGGGGEVELLGGEASPAPPLLR